MVKECRIRLRDHVSLERDPEGPEVVLVDGRSGILYSCNAAAALLVESLQATATAKDLANVLADAFDITHPRASADVDEFLESLHKNELLIEEGDAVEPAGDHRRLAALAD